MTDTYQKFSDLRANAGIDGMFTIELEDRGTKIAFMTPHGGQIEPGTDKIVKILAGTTYTYYTFLGANPSQHITSNRFDEPKYLSLLEKVETIITIHGKKGSEEFIMLGGLDENLIQEISSSLTRLGVTIIPPSDDVSGTSPQNMCNRGTSGKGVQIEISRGLRDRLLQDEILLVGFREAVTSVL